MRALADRQALVVLDNCEQVSCACREMVGSLLSTWPTVTVRVTSRIPLELSAEEVFAIPPMGSEVSGSDPFESDAVALFLDRATAVAGGYALPEQNAKPSTRFVRCSMACRSASSWRQAGSCPTSALP